MFSVRLRYLSLFDNLKVNIMKILLPAITLLFLATLQGCSSDNPPQDNWTHFRGSNLNGIAIVDNEPVTWDEETAIKWKTAIHGRGWSSPVVFGDQVWVTTATADGKELSALCLDFTTGDILFDITVFSSGSTIRKHDINSFSSPTPAIEEGFLYVHYGSLGTACINTSDGSVRWTRTDLECDHVQGPGSSAFLYNDLLILHYEGVDKRFIVALDKHTGKNVWKTHRQEEPYKTIPRIGTKAYVTPLLVNVSGRDLIISNGSAIINAYDPLTGEEVWSIIRGAESTVAMPFEENGIVYFETGFMVDENRVRFSELMAVNPDGTGDISETNVLWTKTIAPFPLSTPVIRDGLIYTVDATRIMRCIDAVSGEDVWSHRLRSQVNSSPVYANGKVYFSSTRGETIIIEAGRELNIIAENSLDGEIWATPAILRNSVLIRTDSHLYRIANP
jgi:outer membrane protein assembly factor BamB